ncbi:MAG: hypothetical protein ACP5GU_01060 [Thermoprotei archaeon]|jgi:hypothetical protein
MPVEIFDEKEFLEIAKRAKECRVKRSGDVVKLKLRTSSKLYTYKISPEKAENLIKQITCPIVTL